MQLCLFRFISTMVFVTGTILLFTSAAQADCGKSQFNAFASQAQAAEAIPLTPDTLLVDKNKPPSLTEPKRSKAAIGLMLGTQSCPDESPATDNALALLHFTWREAVRLQGNTAVLSFIKAGKTAEPQACLPSDIAYNRMTLADAWNTISVSGSDVTISVPDLKTQAEIINNPHYGHVNKIMMSLARNNQMRLPALTTDMRAWKDSYRSAWTTAQAHAPDGIMCSFSGDYVYRR
jgi:hypothetical protein